MIPVIVITECKHRWREVAEVLVELEGFTLYLREFAIGRDSNGLMKRVTTICLTLTSLLDCNFLQVVGKLLSVPLN